MARRFLMALGILASLGGTASAQAKLDSLGDPLAPGAVARLGTLRLQHAVGDVIEAVAYSGDGKLLASRGRKGGIRVWDAATGQELRRLDAPPDTSNSNLAFGATGASLIAGAGNDVRVWNAATGELLNTYRGAPAKVLAVAFADGDKAVAAVAADGVMRWWDRDSGKVTRELTLAGPDKGKALKYLHYAVLAPGARALALQAGGHDRDAEEEREREDDPPDRRWSTTLIYDLEPGKLTWHHKGQLSRRMNVGFAADGKRFAVAIHREFGEWTLELHDTAAGGSLASATLTSYQSREPRDDVAALAFAADGKSIAAAREGWSVVAWDLEDRTVHSRAGIYSWSDYDRPRCVTFAPDGKRLAVGMGHQLYFRDAATLRAWTPWPLPRGGIKDVRFTDQGHRVVARAGATGYGAPDVFTWEAGTWKLLGRLPLARGNEFLSGDPSGAGDVQVVPHGNSWAFVDPHSGKRLGTVDVPSRKGSEGYLSEFSPRGTVWTQLFQEEGAERSVLRLFAVPSGKRLAEVHWTGGGARAFSDDERLYAACDAIDGRVYVVDLATGKEKRQYGSKSEGFGSATTSAAFSPDGKLLAVWSSYRGEAVVWDVATGKERCRAKCPPRKGDYPPAVCLALSPDGKTLAAGAVEGDSSVRLFEVETGKPRGTLTGHQGIVNTLTFAPDGRLLLSGSADATVLVWDAFAKPGP